MSYHGRNVITLFIHDNINYRGESSASAIITLTRTMNVAILLTWVKR